MTYSLLDQIFFLLLGTKKPFSLLNVLGKLAGHRDKVKMSNPHSVNGSESEFEFIETPKAPTPTFEKFEDCGVRTTSVREL